MMTTPFGRLLHVNLSDGEARPLALDPTYITDFVGGSGLGVRLLWDCVTPQTDPLGPGNPLLFLTGPLTGTHGPATGRFTVCARSPLTGLWGEAHCGGMWGGELRHAGYDGLLITGQAPSPVYLWIENGRAELRDGAHLWGQADTYETQEAIRREVGQSRARVACIGEAGERQVPFSVILADHGRVAGRSGMGTVMGSKYLKAVAVRGERAIPLADGAAYGALSHRINAELKEDLITRILREIGTGSPMDLWAMLGNVPTRYFTRGQFEGVDKISGTTLAETILTGVMACDGCVAACGRRVTISDGPYAHRDAKGPEYETMCALGPLLLNDDLAAITYLGDLCDRLGLDTISMGVTLAFALYLYDERIIGSRETGGLELGWGDPELAALLIERTARREGFGALLAEGSRALGRRFGVEDLALQVNGQEVAMHDPRAFSGMALAYATSPRGACHNEPEYYLVETGMAREELGIPLLDRFQCEGKAIHVARLQDWRSVSNSLVVCLLAPVPPADVPPLLNAAMGWDLGLEDLLHIGERIWNLKRAFNCRLGLTRANDRLPRLFLEPLQEGGSAGSVPDLETMLAEYYEARGWDSETGKPTQETLERLDLTFAAGEL
ncbi:MAG: aldehyde ferredoxin oxidoreductase family protein [Anaerolineae bacterium]